VTKLYGTISGEKRVQDSIKAREIAQEILKFGVSQYQITKIIYFLALELEDRDALDGVVEVVKPLLDGLGEAHDSSPIIT
jgi:hypothetical protein